MDLKRRIVCGLGAVFFVGVLCLLGALIGGASAVLGAL
jgi:hypothetical protein